MTEKGTGGWLAPWRPERAVTSPAITWHRQTPSKRKSTSHLIILHCIVTPCLLEANCTISSVAHFWQVVFWEDHSARLRKDPFEFTEQTRNLPGEGEWDDKRWDSTNVWYCIPDKRGPELASGSGISNYCLQWRLASRILNLFSVPVCNSKRL